MNYNTFLAIFGLNPNNFKPVVSDPFETDNSITFYLEQRNDLNRTCPYCYSNFVKIHDYKENVLRATMNENKVCELIIKKVRFKCIACKKTYTPRLDNVMPHSQITNEVKKMIVCEFDKRISFTEIAKKYNVSVGTVVNLFDDCFQIVNRAKMPKILCIDEFHFSKEFEQNYCCIIVDFESKEIVDILKNRRKEYLNEYFSSIDEKERNNVSYFICDMYDEYAIVQRKYFPNATLIVDKFHITLQIKNAIKIRRTKVMKSLLYSNPLLYNFMKRNWELYEQSKNKIPDKTYTNKKTGYVYTYEQLFYKTLNLDHDLNIAYDVMQDLFKLPFRTKDAELKALFNNISNRLITLSDENFQKVGKTYLKWIDGISAAYSQVAYDKRLSNSLSENTNNHIKTLIKISYGLNNIERTRKRAIIISRSNKRGSQF